MRGDHMEDLPALDSLQDSLRPLREQVVNHAVYSHLKTPADLRIFMEHHVFAVWDFMSLVKALQRHLTCVTVPWVPRGHPLSRRLINEIVLAEESDQDPQGGYISHFELYRAAMGQCGADLSRIDRFVDHVRQGMDVSDALALARVPPPVQAFVSTTCRIVDSGCIHAIAAAFTMGREHLIPDMFRALVAELKTQFGGPLTLFEHYLARHIDLDQERHTPMAHQMLVTLCDGDQRKWSDAVETAQVSLKARIALWDGVVDQLALARGAGLVRSAHP